MYIFFFVQYLRILSKFVVLCFQFFHYSCSLRIIPVTESVSISEAKHWNKNLKVQTVILNTSCILNKQQQQQWKLFKNFKFLTNCLKKFTFGINSSVRYFSHEWSRPFAFHRRKFYYFEEKKFDFDTGSKICS